MEIKAIVFHLPLHLSTHTPPEKAAQFKFSSDVSYIIVMSQLNIPVSQFVMPDLPLTL